MTPVATDETTLPMAVDVGGAYLLRPGLHTNVGDLVPTLDPAPCDDRRSLVWLEASDARQVDQIAW